jgi:hypothetical protein
MYNSFADVSVNGCTFRNNRAEEYYGGGMYNYDSNVTVYSCTFEGNYAYYDGGGMANENSDTASAFPGGGAEYAGNGQ